MRPDDLAYYRERAATERKRVEICQNEAVAAIHEELARQYEALVQQARLLALLPPQTQRLQRLKCSTAEGGRVCGGARTNVQLGGKADIPPTS